MFKKILFASIILIILAGCSSTQEEKKETADMSDYGITSTNFVEVSFDEALEIVNNENAILYFGYPECPWCYELVPVLDEAASETGATVYYVKTKVDGQDLRTADNESYQKLVEIFATSLSTDDEGNLKIYVPYVVEVKDGNLVASHSSTVPNHDANEREMSSSEIKELKNALIELLTFGN